MILRSFTQALREMGFDKMSDYHVDGERLVVFTRKEGDRRIDLQLWGDGKHRVSHWIGGRMTTHPTDFGTVGEMRKAIEIENTRTDNDSFKDSP